MTILPLLGGVTRTPGGSSDGHPACLAATLPPMLRLRCAAPLGVLLLAVGLGACGPDDLGPGEDGGGGGMDAGPDGCEPPFAMCGSVCVNTRTDALNCGGCGNECTGGTFCAEGTCTRSCPGGLSACGSSCVDPATDREHCGGCDMPCDPDRDCMGGSCVCPEGYIECDGTCVDPESDADHCGVCGRECAADEACSMGSCTCATGAREELCDDGEDDDCDGMIDCADSDCDGATRECMGSCGAGVETCSGGTWGDCEGGDGGEEICGDGIDQDCDGFDIRLKDGWEGDSGNDTCDTCALISEDTDPNVFLNATMDSVYDDVDCYRFVADDGCCAREYINLTLENIPAGHDYDMTLYRNYDDCVSRTVLASNYESGNADETISWGERFAAGDSGTYYIRITRFRGYACYPEDPDRDNYRLTVNGLR